MNFPINASLHADSISTVETMSNISAGCKENINKLQICTLQIS